MRALSIRTAVAAIILSLTVPPSSRASEAARGPDADSSRGANSEPSLRSPSPERSGGGRPRSVAAGAAGATRSGTAGLSRTFSAQRLPAGASVLKVESGYFTANDFMLDGYKHRSLDWGFSYTHSGGMYSMFERLEFGLAVEGRSDVIRPPEEAARSNGYFGNTTVGVKGQILRGPMASLSMLANVRTSTPSREGQIGLSSSSPSIVAAGSLDFQPLLIHLNVGAYFDRSNKALDRDIRTLTRPFRFAQGAYVGNSWLAGLGLETQLRPLSAYVDVFTYQDLDGKSIGSSFADSTSDRLLEEKISFRQNPIWLTPGVRVPVAKRWQVEAAADLGFLSGDFPGAEDQQILPPWRAVLGFSYFTAMPDAQTRSHIAASQRTASIRGSVVDGETGQILESAPVFVGDAGEAAVTIPGGHFVADSLEPGEHVLKAVVAGYEPTEQTVTLEEGKSAEVLLKLQRAKPKPVEVAAAPPPPQPEPKVEEPPPQPEPVEVEEPVPAAAAHDPNDDSTRRPRSVAEGAEPARESQPVEVARLDPIGEGNMDEDLPLTQKVAFRFDGTGIDPGFHPALDEVAQLLQEHPDVILRVVGHTDDTGSPGLNKWVSLRRATAVADYLATRGIDRKRLVPVAMGSRRPVAPNSNRAGRMQNRRADFDPFKPAPWHVEFGYDRAGLPPGAAVVLDEIVSALTQQPDFNVNVDGHSDSQGTVEGIQRVALARARAAAQGLAKRGVPSDRMRVTGKGDLEPVASNEDAAGRALNRRVDFRLFQPQPTPEKITTN